MRAKVHHEGNGDRAHPVFQIETAEDCAMAEQRLQSLSSSSRGENEESEFRALKDALERWHGDHAASRKDSDR